MVVVVVAVVIGKKFCGLGIEIEEMVRMVFLTEKN